MKETSNSLLQSLLCTAVFAIVFGTIVNCGGGSTGQLGLPGTGSSSAQSPTSILVSLSKPNMVALPISQTSTPVIASMFQTTGGSSQLAQSFQGDAGPAAIMQMSSQTSGFIAIGSNESHPGGIFAHIGDSADTTGKTWPVVGFPVFQNGTVAKLVVSALTTTSSRIRCNDLSSTAAVTDGQLIEPWFDIASGSISLATGPTTLSLTCSLNTPASNISFISVYWAKT